MIDAILHHSQQAKQHVDASLYPRGTCSKKEEKLCSRKTAVFYGRYGYVTHIQKSCGDIAAVIHSETDKHAQESLDYVVN